MLWKTSWLVGRPGLKLSILEAASGRDSAYALLRIEVEGDKPESSVLGSLDVDTQFDLIDLHS